MEPRIVTIKHFSSQLPQKFRPNFRWIKSDNFQNPWTGVICLVNGDFNFRTQNVLDTENRQPN